MTGPVARNPMPGEPEYRERWTDALTPYSTQDDAMRVAHERPLISTCSWNSRSFCDCPVGDVVGRLWNAGMLKKGQR